MIEISELQGRAFPVRRVVAQAETFDEAKAKARELFAVVFMHDDHQHEDCADFITEQGAIYAIQPQGFRL